MMKKVLLGVALALMACVSVGTLQSCKDDVSDLRTQTSYDLAQLQQALENKSADLQRQINANRTDIDQLIEDLKLYATVKYVNEEIAKVKKDLGDRLTLVQADVNTIKGDLVNIKAAVAKIPGLESDVASLKQLTAGHTTAIEELKGRINASEGQITNLETALEDLKDQMADNSAEIQILKGKVATIKRDLETLRTEFDALKDDVEALTTRVDDIEKALEELTEKVDDLVTGILIQSVYSPVFGDFSLPIGVKSNIAFNWYGYNGRGEQFKFPSNETKGYNIGATNFNFDGSDYFMINDGVYSDDVNLGTVYVSLNPLGNNFSDTPLNVVNSLGEPLPFTVTLKKSTKELTHGYTRADEAQKIDSYLYEGTLKVAAADIDKVSIKIEDNLESAMKKALKNPGVGTAATLLKAVYDQMSGMLPAYALEYAWTVGAENTPYSVLSQYDLAVATARPLGYNFLKREGDFTDKQLPTDIGDIDNFINKLKDKVNGKINIKIDPIQLGNLNINFENLGVNVSTDNVNLLIVLPDMQIWDAELAEPVTTTLVLSTQEEAKFNWEKELENYGGYDPKTDENPNGKIYDYTQITGLKSLDQAINDGIQDALNKAGVRISDQVKNQIQDQINQNVIAKLQSQINTQISDMIDGVFDEFEPYFNKVNKAFEIYNKIAGKINNFLKNPNDYLQATAVYNMGGDYGFVSAKPGSPTVYKGNGDFNIYLTSYTGELIVPAYKKYVAITGKVANGKVTRVNCNDAMNSGDLNKVMDGNRIRVTVPASKLSAGTYEFTYQALDYRGYTSTRKFYVQIVK